MSKLKNIAFLIFALVVLSSCTTKSPTPTAVVPESPTAEATVIVAPVTNECLNCHTEKQRLIDTAKPVVVAEAESKGVG